MMKVKSLNPRWQVVRSALFSLPLAGALGTASPIAVINPSFEASNSGTPTGWADVAGGAGAFVATTSQYDPLTLVPDGANVASVFGGFAGDGISQVLAATLQADTSYTLTVKIGDPADALFDGYTIQLLANGTVLAQDDNTQTPADGNFATATASYVYNVADAALVGQPLEIRLLGKGLFSDGELGTGDVHFDDVQLNVVLANPVASPGGPYTVPANGSLSLDGSASLPSDGQTITTYEWDLDNDGDFDEAITGATPTTITYANLQSTYGMIVGANTIQLRVTDDSSPTPKTATASATVTLSSPIQGQLGILDLNANGGINPNTGNPWQVGDQYRLAFHTLNTTDALSNDPDYYNGFATTEAWAVPALQRTYWRAMVTVNLNSDQTEADSPDLTVKDNTGTGDLSGGAGIGGAGMPVYVVDGQTCIARNNADIWNSWSNPFAGGAVIRVAPPVSSQNVHYSPFLNQFGNQTVNPDNVHGKDIWTGVNSSGDEVNALGASSDVTSATHGNTNANSTGRIWQRFTRAKTDQKSLYVISNPLTVVDLSETTAPNLISFLDDRSGADLFLGTGSIVYTVTFDEVIDITTLSTGDFGNNGSASITVDGIAGTLDPAVFEVTVTPTTGGTVELQINASANIEDLAGNELDTTAAIVDDTSIAVVDDSDPPTVVSFANDAPGGSILTVESVTYTVTFSEAINASTVDVSDFGNAVPTGITIDSVTPTGDPAVFLVGVSPTEAGTIQLEIVQDAVITDIIGNALDTTSAIVDGATVTVTLDTTLPELDSIVDSVGGGSLFVTLPVTYTVSFNEPIDATSVDTADFGYTGSATATIDSVTPTGDPAVFEVIVTTTGAGNLTFEIAQGATIQDLTGNFLDASVAIPDDTTITVDPLPPLVGELGVWSPLANGGINPANGQPWAAGDTYRLVFVTSGTTNALSTDITTYNAFVQAAAAASSTYPNLGNGTWNIVGSTATVDARDNTGTNPGSGTGVPVILMDGKTMIAQNNADLWDGISAGVSLDENGNSVAQVSVFTGSFDNGTSVGTSGNDKPLGVTDGEGVQVGRAASTSWMRIWKEAASSNQKVYAMSGVLTVQAVGGTPYGNWATGGELFGDDANGDGVSNGLAFLLGAANPNVSALGLLPTPSEDGSGGLVMTFTMLDSASRGTATLSVEHSSDLGISDAWTTVAVPDASDGPTSGVTFVVSGSGTLGVTATVDSGEAGGGKLFGRLKATE